MESTPQNEGLQDTQSSRLRTDTHASGAEAALHNLTVSESSYKPEGLTDYTHTQQPAIQQTPLQRLPGLPIPRQLQPFAGNLSQTAEAALPTRAPNLINNIWDQSQSGVSYPGPSIHLDGRGISGLESRAPFPSTARTDAYNQPRMSAITAQAQGYIDSPTGRPSYAWQGYETNNIFPEQPSNLLNPFHHESFVPAYPRSVSSSPQGFFTAEQREVKRQRDLARRESKSRLRRDRATSTPDHSSVSATHDGVPGTAGLPPQHLQPLSNSAPPHGILSPQNYVNAHHEGPPPSSEMFPQYPIGSMDFSTGYLTPFQPLPAEQVVYPTRPIPMPEGSVMVNSPYSYAPPSSSSREHVDPDNQITAGRPKPQCWDHGCNGRQFSTFSNLLRHQREKSGIAAKPSCPRCGAEFTRTTARNGHMAHEKCKPTKGS